MTRFTLWYNTVIRLELSGLCGWLKLKDNLKVTRRIFPLPLTKWATLRAKVTRTADLDYWEYRDGEIYQKFIPEQVFPIIYPHPASPFQGMSPLMAQTYPYDIDLFLMQQQRAFFEHGATPGLHLTTDQNLTPDQVDELKETIHEQYAGALKAGDTLITHSGLKASAVGQTARQAMIDEVARFSRDKLITSFDLSPAKVGLVEDVNRANMAGLDRIFIHECMRPKCMLMEESIESFFLPDYDQGLTCDFELPSTEDQDYELKAMETRIRTKVTVINEERENLGMEPVDWGKRPWGSFTDVQLAGERTAIPKPIPTDEGDDGDGKRLLIKQVDISFWTDERKDTYWKIFASEEEGLEQVFLIPMQRHFKAQCEAIIQRLNTEGKKVIGQYAGWSRQRIRQHLKENKTNLRAININEKDEREALVKEFTPVIQTIMKEYGDVRIEELNNIGKTADQEETKAIAFEFNVNDPAVLKWLGSRTKQFSRQVAGTTFDEIEAILREGFAEGDSIITISETLRQKFESWDQYRAPLIARTETISAMNKADLESVSQTGLEDQLLKHWLSSRDDNTRETHLVADKEYSSEGIGVDEEFRVGQDSMEAPGLGSLAEENINCRCTLYYTEKGE
ncbi:MAG: phage portal protein, partial [Desulfobacterales bacterium]|nr:phage portal protein [Desulfobacterales bacterium]